MKALQITRPGQFEIVDVPRSDPFPDEVIVEVRAINSCTHWDLTVWDGIDIWGRPDHPEYPYTVGAPGHEWAGIVVEKGAQVDSVNVGDRVAYWGSPPGLKTLRQGGKEYGGYVQYVCIHHRSVLPFPQDTPLSFKEMAMLEM
ncbi:MAG TPA: alcohol dehydrogenase catalytic domain-containing protein, partial [Chloroflexota bacterium]|nr:alcohol dehydrogenase catalytic domain-containing protein [Chloroflexota bacterium]